VVLDINVVIAVVGIAGSGGIAWGGTRVALNGTKAKVAEIAASLAEHVEVDRLAQLEAVQRLTRIETKLDSLLE